MPNPVLPLLSERYYMPIVISIDTDRFARYSYWITKDAEGVFNVRCYREYSGTHQYHFINRQWSVATLDDLASTLFHMTPVLVGGDRPTGPASASQDDVTGYNRSIAISITFSFGVEGMAMDGTNLYSDVSELSIDTYRDPLNSMLPLLGSVMYNTASDLLPVPITTVPEEPPALERT